MEARGSRYLFNVRARGDWVRLRTLVVLRWLAITGQAGAVLIGAKVVGFQLPLHLCALLISASVTLNVVAYLIHPAEKRLSERGTLLSLFFDLGQLVTLIMVTGGLNNPFALLIIAPVTISATALRLQSTLLLGLGALSSVALLNYVHLPLILADGTALELPGLYRGGLAAALAIGIVFVSLYTRRVTVEGYGMSRALSATQLALAREQQLAAIGGIAAATAHELGTPLATIKLVAGELAREVSDRPDLAEDVALLKREAQRCGEILADLSRRARDDSHVKRAPAASVVEEAARPHVGRGKEVVIRVGGLPVQEGMAQPMIQRRPELIHGLRNLIQNAVDYAESTVWIDIDEMEERLRIAVGDDGKGFSPDLLPRLGEPYVSTRHRGRTLEEGEYEGMGLGLFIARTLLERTGARLSFANGSDARLRRGAGTLPATLAHPPGAVIEIVWPAERIVEPQLVSRGALGPNREFARMENG